MNLRNTKWLLSLLSMSTLIACSSEPKVTELNINADPQVELDRVDANIKRAQTEQVDVLSPTQYEAARDSWNSATKARASNKNQASVLHHIAVAQAHLDKANQFSKVATPLLKGAIEARHDALAAHANNHYPAETSAADHDLRKIGEQVENSDTSGAERDGAKLESTFRTLELNSIKQERLGPAQAKIKEAIKEGAKKLTPETLAWAEKKMSDDTASIEANRHDTAIVEQAQADANIAADRLVKMVREAKGSTTKNPEQLAQQVESTELAAAKSERDLNQSADALSNTQGKLANASASNKNLQAKVRLDQEFEVARAQFTPDEAEVYKQGDKLLLRLKGLSFATNKAGISANNFPLLAKVQKVIGDIGSSQIAIEGHTDSIGGKRENEALSTKRAQSVQSYLVANNNVTADKVTATGYGDSKPIASNKTPVGRAQNRRVDVIISAESEAR